jgi:hypothetical protein
MKDSAAIALAVALTMAVGPAGHAAEGSRHTTAILAQAGPAPSGGGYDPLARQTGPQPVDPMMPGAPPASPDGEEETALNPEFDNLPDTPGVEDTFYLCTACHSAAIIKQQRLTPARWDYLWTWMVQQQGMPEQDPETKEAILSYLKRHFSWEQ